MQSTVLVASPNVNSRSNLADLFARKGYDVVYGARSGEVTTLVKDHGPGLILLSEDMPPVEGIELLPMLRRLTLAPLIVLGEGGSQSLIKYVLNGADAYINGTVHDQELLIRARNLLKRATLDERSTMGGKESPSIDTIVAKVKTPLTETEMRLFKCLAARRGRLTSGDELMTKVWGKPVKGGRLRFYIHSLRRKLSRHAPFRLHTQKGVGYRLIDADADSKDSSKA